MAEAEKPAEGGELDDGKCPECGAVFKFKIREEPKRCPICGVEFEG